MTRILIAGGYGLVGSWIARHIRAAGHPVELVIGGRRPHAGRDIAQEVDASLARVDTEDATVCLAAAGPVDLVVSALQDPDDRLLRAALDAGSAYIGIVRKADNVGPTAIMAVSQATQPVLLMGHWQAGVTTYATLAAAREVEQVERIEMAALFDPADAAGPMATTDSGSFFSKALIRRDRRWQWITPTDHPRVVERNALPAFTAQPMGVLDVPGIAAVTDAPHVRFDLGIGTSIGSAAGGLPSHEIYVDVHGLDRAGARTARRATVSDPYGQAHLTALGALIGAERILGLDGAAPLGPGLALPERAVDPERAIDRLRQFAVSVKTEPLLPQRSAA